MRKYHAYNLLPESSRNTSEDIILKKLNDYSGEFLPDLKPEDFSHDTLAELLRVYSQLYIAMDGFWYLAVMERSGNEEALACDLLAWEKVCKYEMAKVTKHLNIQGNDVIALMKAMQVLPWFHKIKCEVNIKNSNNATMTVTHCPTLEALEKEGSGRESEICRTVELKIFEGYASFFNPGIETKPLKLPPRGSKDEVCCQWEFKLEE